MIVKEVEVSTIFCKHRENKLHTVVVGNGKGTYGIELNTNCLEYATKIAESYSLPINYKENACYSPEFDLHWNSFMADVRTNRANTYYKEK